MSQLRRDVVPRELILLDAAIAVFVSDAVSLLGHAASSCRSDRLDGVGAWTSVSSNSSRPCAAGVADPRTGLGAVVPTSSRSHVHAPACRRTGLVERLCRGRRPALSLDTVSGAGARTPDHAHEAPDFVMLGASAWKASVRLLFRASTASTSRSTERRRSAAGPGPVCVAGAPRLAIITRSSLLWLLEPGGHGVEPGRLAAVEVGCSSVGYEKLLSLRTPRAG